MKPLYLQTIVALLNQEASRLDLFTTNADQVACLADPSRYVEALGMLDDFSARCGMNVDVARRLYVSESGVAAQLRTLAATAIASCNTADQYEFDMARTAPSYREAAQDACEEFFELANSLLTEEQDADLTERCCKATAQESIAHTLNVLGLAS